MEGGGGYKHELIGVGGCYKHELIGVGVVISTS